MPGPITRVNDAVLGFISRFYQLETLYRSNAKYLPEWRPRFLCYEPGLSVARAAIACGRAEGFLPELGIDTVGRRGDLSQPRPEPAIFAAQVVALEEEAASAPARRAASSSAYAATSSRGWWRPA